jgi:translocation and assembly module TamA
MALALALLTGASPLCAQPGIEDLDSLPPLAPIDEDLPPDSDPAAPLPELPGDDSGGAWSVDWPDLSAPLAPLEPLPEAETVEGEEPDLFAEANAETDSDGAVVAEGVGNAPAEIAVADSLRYSVTLRPFGEIADERFQDRFDGLSVLRANDDEPANGAQINRRIREDTELLDRMLRNEGYYDSTVTSAVSTVDGRLEVAFGVEAGPRYTYGAVNLNGLAAAGPEEAARLAPFYARDSLTAEPDGIARPGTPITSGDFIIADDIIDAQGHLQFEMRETGYPFGTVGEELVTIDHDVRQGILDQAVTPGARLRFGSIIANDGGLLGARHIQRIARFDPGDWYRYSDTDDLRRALIATGLVASVDIVPIANADGATVDTQVDLTPAPPRTISGLLGYSSGQGFRAEASWEHRNLFPPEGALILRGIAGTREQLGSVTYRRNNFRGRDRVLTVQALASNIDSDAFDARTIHLSARLERATTLIFQKRWSWAFGAEVLGTDELAFVPARNADLRRRYLIGGAFGLVSYDRSNNLLDPTRGYRLTARIAPEVSLNNGTRTYVRGQFDATGYLPLSDRVVLAGRARIGTIVGAERDDIAPSRRYYAGGGGSVRGYGYQRIGPRSADNDPVGGTGLFEIAAEARIKLFGDFSLVPFVDAGNVYDSSFPDIADVGDLQYGAGVGIRYATNFGPIRVDVGTPINPRPGDSRIGVYVSLGQAF